MNEPQTIKCPNCQKDLTHPSEPGIILCTNCGTKINFVGDPMQNFRNRLTVAVAEAGSLGVHIDLLILTVDLLHDELLVMRRMELAKQAAKPPLIVPANGIPRQIKPIGN